MTHSSYIELDEKAYHNNLAFIKDHLKKGTRLSVVVKGNAYGHGIKEITKFAESGGIDHISVFNAFEASKVLGVRQQADIMIMGYIDDNDLEWAIKNEIEFYVFDKHRLKAAIESAKKQGVKAKIHLEMETGMNRLGIPEVDLSEVMGLVEKNTDHLRLKGVCTHFAGAESIANYQRIRQQKIKFRNLIKQFKACKTPPEGFHACCSAAMFRHPDMHFDMVRIGILTYGFWPSREILVDYLKDKGDFTDPLKRLISWKSKIMDIKKVKKGEFVGYGNAFLAESDMEIALIPVGYSEGYSRVLSNTGRVLINGERMTVAGIVNMNLISVEISNLENVKRGDEVVMIGRQNDNEISVSSFSEFSKQLNYEMLTRLPHDIPRMIINKNYGIR